MATRWRSSFLRGKINLIFYDLLTRTTLRHRMQHTVQSKGANKWRSATRTSPSLWESSSSSSYQSSSYYNQYFTIITTTITIATIIVTMTPMISDTPSACVTRLCATPTRTTSVEAQGALSSSSSTWKTPPSLSKNRKIFQHFCSVSSDTALHRWPHPHQELNNLYLYFHTSSESLKYIKTL